MKKWLSNHFDGIFISLIAVATVLTRMPFRSKMLYNWDAVQFAMALKEYDVAKHQPHPPGYIFYVGMGKLISFFIKDANSSFVFISILLSFATAVAVYYLAKSMYDVLSAVAATTLLLVSPLFWFYGEVSLSYVGEAFFTSIVAFLIYQVLKGKERFIYISALYLGMAGGFRQTIIMLFFPLWAISVLTCYKSIKKFISGFIVLCLSMLIWFIPMVWLTGGFERYRTASEELFSNTIKATSIFAHGNFYIFLLQTKYLIISTLVGLGVVAIFLVYLPFRIWWGMKRKNPFISFGKEGIFLIGWILPPILFYSMVHFGQAGYVLSYLPGIYILLGRALVISVEDITEKIHILQFKIPLLVFIITFLVFINGKIFVNAKPVRLYSDSSAGMNSINQFKKQLKEDYKYWIWDRSAGGLKENDQVIHTYVTAIKKRFAPQETVILTEAGNPRSYTWLRHAIYYIPEYSIFQVKVGEDLNKKFYHPMGATNIISKESSIILLPFSTKRIIWFVDYFNPLEPKPRGMKEIPLDYGRWLYSLEIGRKPVYYSGYTFVKAKKPVLKPLSRKIIQKTRPDFSLFRDK